MSEAAPILEITLLGAPGLAFQGAPAPALPAKGQALVYYLAASAAPAARQRLAGLLWSDQPEDEARRNLRVTLSAVQQALPGLLQAGRAEIALDPGRWRSDLGALWAGLRGADWGRRTQALSLYRGELLAGLSLRGAPLFEEWLAIERQRLAQALLEAWKTLGAQALAQGQAQALLPFAAQALEFDRLDEDSHYLLMQLYAAAGQPGAALRQFERCRELLAQELGLEPAARTRQLYEKLRQAMPAAAAAIPLDAPLPAHNLPAAATPFLGRQSELERLQALLAQPDCRLLTLTGPGGAGKTRLALALAERLLGSAAALFPDGVCFAPLAGLETADGLWQALAGALGLELQTRPAPAQQVRRVLRRRCLLLLLDNLEQLQAQAGELAALLAEAPGLKLLVTSRAPLDLYEEWVFEVGGLALGETPESEAAQLFSQAARRARLNFDLAAEWPHVRTICALVEGLPLGLELAAAWTRSLPVSQVAALLERSRAALSTPLRNLPARQASLEAVFESSWALLAAEDQQALAGLAVFPADFDLQAAEAVAQATPRHVSRLASASLLQRTPGGRCRLHPWIRESAARKDPQPGAWQAAHARYFSGRLLELTPNLLALDGAVLAQAEAEMPNLRQMWAWAIAAGDVDLLAGCAPGLAGLCDQRGWLHEGQALLQQAMPVCSPAPQAAAQLAVQAGRLLVRQGLFAEARQALEPVVASLGEQPGAETLADAPLAASLGEAPAAASRGEAPVAASLDEQPVVASLDEQPAAASLGEAPAAGRSLLAQARNQLGVALRELGQVDAAQRQFDLSRAAFAELGDVAGQASSLVNAAGLNLRLGRHAQAYQLGSQALALFRTQQAPGLLVVPLSNQGAVALELGLYDEAQACFEEGLAIAQQTGMRLMIAGLHTHLGALAIHRQQYEQAGQHLRQAQAVAEQTGSLEALARIYNDLGTLYERQERLAEALPWYEKALETNQVTQNSFSVAINLNNLGFLKRELGRVDAARQDHARALELALAIDAAPLALDAIIGLGAVLHTQGRPDLALGCFALARQHPDADRQTQEELQAVMTKLGLPAARLDGVPPLAEDLEQAAAVLLDSRG